MIESCSQSGEDAIAFYYLVKIRNIQNGGYVDIGAADPRWCSNTYLFYTLGWRGVLVEPRAQACENLRHHRPGDLVLNAGCGLTKGQLPLHELSVGELSTFLPPTVTLGAHVGNFPEQRLSLVNMMSLADIMLTSTREVNLLSVDTEGMELEVLQSNDWDKYRPLIIIVETKKYGTGERNEPEITNYMNCVGYGVLADTALNTLYCSDPKLWW